jgi:hypothetical protein
MSKPLIRFKLGATLAPPDPRTFDMMNYVDLATVLPKIPSGPVGHGSVFPTNSGILANDRVGDCVVAGTMHAIMQANILGGHPANFTSNLAVKTYSKWTGYIPGDQATDKGTDPVFAARQWQHNGVVDTTGNVHRIIAYFTIPTGHFDALRAALYLFDFAGICLNLPESAQTQFPSRKWTYDPASPVEGGHFTLALNDDGANTELSTWGSTVDADREFMSKQGSLWLGYVTTESLVNGKSAEGFAIGELLEDVAAVRALGR